MGRYFAGIDMATTHSRGGPGSKAPGFLSLDPHGLNGGPPARSVKWVSRIECRGEPLGAIALNSVIRSPEPGQTIARGRISCFGWAIGENAEPIDRVEVSPDDGASWLKATVEPSEDRWTWRLWSIELDLQPGTHRLAVRAFDRSGRTQPEHLSETWNVKGYANNAWHRVEVKVVKE